MKTILILAIALGAMLAAVQAQGRAVLVPFVGCAADGQVGPELAPVGKSRAVELDPQVASRLAFYQSNYDRGLLAPRGWHCIALEGSNGSLLFVTPKPRTAEDLLLHDTGISGPAVQLSIRYGETSGRFEVAEIAARYFPKQRAFVDRVIAEGIEPASAFPSHDYPGDRVISRTGNRIEIETPPRTQGLGTRSRLLPDGRPIHSVARLGREEPPNLVLLTVKLPEGMDDLLPAIVHHAP